MCRVRRWVKTGWAASTDVLDLHIWVEAENEGGSGVEEKGTFFFFFFFFFVIL